MKKHCGAQVSCCTVSTGLQLHFFSGVCACVTSVIWGVRKRIHSHLSAVIQPIVSPWVLKILNCCVSIISCCTVTHHMACLFSTYELISGQFRAFLETLPLEHSYCCVSSLSHTHTPPIHTETHYLSENNNTANHIISRD